KLMEESISKEIYSGLEILSPREVQVVVAYYGLNGSKAYSLDEIAHMFNLSKERVRQIRDRAIRRMRKSFSRNSLMAIFG
ncbi:MAG TPA: sigma factor-like helix-turn-helix DNA-binding protein, partial [Saprospiraceae bacterium]|nr:sigma factor-like helix-turn-helix DNA-binding protein [Saprospiraceae bacterium]